MQSFVFFFSKIRNFFFKLIRNKSYTSVSCVRATQSRTQCDNNKKICMKHKNNSKANWKQQKKAKKTKKIKNDFSFYLVLVAWALAVPSAALVVPVGGAASALFRFYLVRCLLPSGVCMSVLECVCVCVSCERARKGNLTQFYRRAMFITFPFLFVCFIRCFASFPLLINVCFASCTFRLDQHIDTAHARRCRCCPCQQQQHSQIQHSQRRSWQRPQQPEQY